MNLVANTTYTFSAYVNTSAVADFTSDTAGVVLQALDGTTIRGTSTALNTRTNPAVNGGWQRVSVTFMATRTAAHNLRVIYRGFIGTAWADDLQLEIAPLGTGPSSPNLLQNGGFESGTIGLAGLPQAVGLWSRNTNNSGFVTAERLGGSQSLRMPGRPTERELVFQDVPINLPGTQTFVLSGWAKANSVPLAEDDANPRTANSGASFGMMARITYANGTTEDHHLRFNADIQAGVGINGWQFGSAPVVPRQPTLTVQTIRVYIHYNFNANVAWFDNISLVQEAAQTFRYDANGNLVGVTESDLRDTTMAYNATNNLIRQVTRGHGTFHYTYDSRNNLVRVISGPDDNTTNHNLMLETAYNAAGNATRSVLTGRGNAAQLVSTASYSADQHLVNWATDMNGVTRTNTFTGVQNQMRGTPSDTTDGRGIVTSHRYNQRNGRPTYSFQAGRIVVYYTYARGALSQIRREGFLPNGTRVTQDYNFNYNSHGQVTQMRVGTRELAAYTYNADLSLQHRLYANRHRVDYGYDNLGRVRTITHRNGTAANSPVHTVFTYTYTGDGQLHSVHDSSTGRLVEYTYDSLGRLVTYAERNANGSIRQSGNQRYDDAGRVSSFAYDIPSIPRENRRYTYEFNASTGNLTTLGLATGANWRLTYTYDHLQRLTSRWLHGGVSWETRYAYRARGGNDSTLQARFMTHTIGGTNLQYEYAYDAIGQITWWQDPVANARHTYTYDDQNQLTRETIVGGGLNHTFDYTYDTYGNIRNRVHRNGSVTRTTTLAYDNAQWRDLLTQINLNGAVTNISYDGNTGNPTNWHSGTTFTWARGRQLQRVQRAGLDVTFTYDHDGIRTEKRVNRNGVITEHTFYTQNGLIVGETRRNASGMITDRLEFIYDESGRPVQLIHNNVVYNYVLNMQGDVQQIRRASDGVVVATYLYNAWGELLSSSGTLAGINPLRYRGKFYDVSIGLYYLNSRFYDPVIGRFVNADAFLSTGQGFLGLNAFAYCLNNPVMRIDPSGYVSMAGWNVRDWRSQVDNPPASQVRAANREGNRQASRLQGQQKNNTNPQAALDAFRFYGSAHYRGAPVRPQPIPGFGPMALNGTIWLTNDSWITADTVSHEWGHLVDERYRGRFGYVITVGIPSTLSVAWDRLFGTNHHSGRSFEVRADNFAATYSTLPEWRRGTWEWRGSWNLYF